MPKFSFSPRGLKQFLKHLAGREVQALFPDAPPVAVGLAFGMICSLIGIALRMGIDQVWAGAGPFGLIMPVVLAATLFGRLSAGLTCLTILLLHAWFAVLPVKNSFGFEFAADGPRVAVNVFAGLFVVVLAELFRRTVQTVLQERAMLLHELEHRVKNNFASVESILRMQMREHRDDPVVAEALSAAITRMQTYSLVNAFLYRSNSYTGDVDMGAYLKALAEAIRQTIGAERLISVSTDLDSVTMDRDQAIGVGLIVNELITNSIKHAFDSSEGGSITISLKMHGEQPLLTVADDGSGFHGETRAESLGMKLVTSLARQANADVETKNGIGGTSYTFRFAA